MVRRLVLLFMDDFRQMYIIIKLVLLILILVIIAIIDIREYRIPNKLLLMAIGIRLLVFIAELIQKNIDAKEISNKVIIITLILFIGVIVNIFTHNGIGFGDIKLLMVVSLFVEYKVIVDIIIGSILIMGLITIVLLLFRKKGRKDIVPFAPTILLSVIVTGVSYL